MNKRVNRVVNILFTLTALCAFGLHAQETERTLQSAWQNYHQTLDHLRKELEATTRYAANPDHRAMAYYVGYFVVLPQYLLPSAEDVSSALSRFKRMFVISFAIGVVDLAFSMTGTYLVPRHLSDWLYVEAPCHGLSGERRRAPGHKRMRCSTRAGWTSL